jgi:3'(2'), 5'-bisphosphate nucleotidase
MPLPTFDKIDIDFLISIAREAGAAILEIYESDFTVETKSDTSPLTKADSQSHKIIVTHLLKRYPKIPIISEESSNVSAYEERSKWKMFWLIDPLDGTKEFIKRNGQFTVNIALILDSRPHVGIVYAPALDLLYWGQTGQGAFKKEASGQVIKLEMFKPKPNDKLVITGSLSHSTPAMETFLDEQRAQHKSVEFVAMGSSLKLCMVADGSANIYPRFGPTMEWDTAAAHAIVNASGHKVLRYGSSEELYYNKRDLHNSWFLVY